MGKKVIKRLMAKDGSTYQKEGQQKNGYMRCGVMLKDDQNGEISIKISGLPISFDGWLSAWDLEGKNINNQQAQQQQPQQYQQAQQQGQQQPTQQGQDDFSDIPF